MHRVVLSFLISFLLLLIVIALNRLTYNKTKNFTGQVEHSRSVIKLYDNLAIQLRSAEIYTPTYENSLAKKIYTIYKTDLENLETNLLQLKDSISDNKDQAVIVDSISTLIQKHLPVLRKKNMVEIIASGEGGRFEDLERAHHLIDEGLALEEKLLGERRTVLTSSNSLYNTLTILLAILAIVIITITFFNQFFLSKKSLWLEGFLESILNTSQNGILHCKAIRENGVINDFKIMYANRATEELLVSEPNKLIGKKWNKIGLKDPGLFGAFRKVIIDNAPLQMEYLQVNATNERWYAVSIAKMDDGVTVAFHDITAVKNYQQDLTKNIAALEQSNQELEEYAYAASHDLQEPLRKIRTFAGFLQDTESNKLGEKGKLQLTKILQSAERMTLLIKDLLSFSSLQHKEKFAPTNLSEILENVLQDLDLLIKQKSAIITHDILPELNAIPIQINQLFYNLVSNSLKFSRPDLPLHLDISCRQLTAQDVADVVGLQEGIHYYELTFSDNGIGFNADYATQIFGLFKRLNDKNIYTGSGIGLALCKKVVINHGGIITANGKVGLGAQFYIYLPQEKRQTNENEGNT